MDMGISGIWVPKIQKKKRQGEFFQRWGKQSFRHEKWDRVLGNYEKKRRLSYVEKILMFYWLS